MRVALTGATGLIGPRLVGALRQRGDEVTVLTQTGPHQFPLVGTARFGTIDSPGGANVALFDLPTAQEVLLGHTGEVDAVVVDAVPGVSENELTGRIESVLPDGQEALTGSEITTEQQDAIADAVSVPVTSPRSRAESIALATCSSSASSSTTWRAGGAV